MPVGNVSWWLESPVMHMGQLAVEGSEQGGAPFDEVGRVVEAEGSIGILDVVVGEEVVHFLALYGSTGRQHLESSLRRRPFGDHSPHRRWPNPS